MVSKQVDSVLKALYSTPAGKNTIVIIMADHGDGMASHRMVTKHISFYDEMTNVPFIFAGPGIKQQKKPIDQVLTQPTLDLLPTLCDLAGIPVPVEKPGISLAPILKGEKQKKLTLMSFPNGIANMNMSLLPDVWYADRDTSTLTIWKVTEKSYMI